MKRPDHCPPSYLTMNIAMTMLIHHPTSNMNCSWWTDNSRMVAWMAACIDGLAFECWVWGTDNKSTWDTARWIDIMGWRYSLFKHIHVHTYTTYVYMITIASLSPIPLICGLERTSSSRVLLILWFLILPLWEQFFFHSHFFLLLHTIFTLFTIYIIHHQQ